MAGASVSLPLPAVDARIGPNSVIQCLRAVAEIEGESARRRIVTAARLADANPRTMIPEAWFVDVVREIRADGAIDAELVLRQAGAYTADYVAQHRIPGLFKAALRWLPGSWAVRALLFGIQRHAWTFAGSSPFRIESIDAAAAEYALVLDDCPTCRRPGPNPGGAYYEAAFEGLLQLALPGLRVREIQCRRVGANACRFTTSFTPKESR